jgi:hypothetical protein
MLLSLEAKQIVQAVKLVYQNAHSEFNYRRLYFCFMSLCYLTFRFGNKNWRLFCKILGSVLIQLR